MNRREILAATAALTVIPVSGGTKLIDNSDNYWDAQWHINVLEEELSEMRAHAKIMKNASVV